MENNQTMKASELRIGNYVNFKNRDDILYCEVIILDKCGYIHLQRTFKDNLHNDDQPESIEDITPIPLTEEWLLRMGAKRNRDGWYLSADYMLYNPLTHLDARSSEYYALMYNDKIITTRPIQYIHQLQNLYYSLTGQELEIKES